MPGRYENLFKRVAVSVVAIPLILWAAMAGSYFFFVMVALISSLAQFEFYELMKRKGASPLVVLGLISGLLVHFVFIYERSHIEIYRLFLGGGIPLRMFSQLQLLLVVQVVSVLVILLVELFRTTQSPSLNIAATLAGIMVIALPLGLLTGLRELFPYGFPAAQFLGSPVATDEQMAQIHSWGGWTILAIFLSIWICDTAAYFVGSAWGKHKLFARVSPGKTWEGAAAGLLGAVMTMAIAQKMFLGYLTVSHAFVLGILIGVFGQMGDLVESRFKRDAGVKDSSSLIPGHGGVYDRFDSLVFVAPIVYLYIDFIVLS